MLQILSGSCGFTKPSTTLQNQVKICQALSDDVHECMFQDLCTAWPNDPALSLANNGDLPHVERECVLEGTSTLTMITHTHRNASFENHVGSVKMLLGQTSAF